MQGWALTSKHCILPITVEPGPPSSRTGNHLLEEFNMNAHLVLRKWMIGICITPLALTCGFAQSAPTPTETSPTLFQTISAQDSVLFNAVNTCDIPTVE